MYINIFLKCGEYIGSQKEVRKQINMPGSSVSIGKGECGWLGVRKEPRRSKAASAKGIFLSTILHHMGGSGGRIDGGRRDGVRR